MLIYMFTLLLGCTEDPKTEQLDTDDTGSPSDTAQDTDTDDTYIVEVDSIEKGRTATTICSAGGQVEGSSISGSFCFGAVDISQGVQATSASFQWQPGPIYPVSP